MNMQLSEIFSGAKPSIFEYLPSEELPLPSTNIGIEIEVENYRGADMFRASPMNGRWDQVSDGSLLNRGVEFVSEKAYGVDILSALDAFSNFVDDMESAGFPMEITDRCGLHIHLDVSDMDVEQLTTLVGLNFLLERALTDISGGRHDDLFCAPVGDSVTHLMALANLCDMREVTRRQYQRDVLRALTCGSKYTGINYLPIDTQGSIEYRMHEGTLDADRILRWIKLIMCIKKYAMDGFRLDGSFPEVVSGAGFADIVRAIFGEYTPDELLSTDVEGFLHRGMRDMQDFLNYRKLLSEQPRHRSLMFRECAVTRLLANAVPASELSEYGRAFQSAENFTRYLGIPVEGIDENHVYVDDILFDDDHEAEEYDDEEYDEPEPRTGDY